MAYVKEFLEMWRGVIEPEETSSAPMPDIEFVSVAEDCATESLSFGDSLEWSIANYRDIWKELAKK